MSDDFDWYSRSGAQADEVVVKLSPQKESRHGAKSIGRLIPGKLEKRLLGRVSLFIFGRWTTARNFLLAERSRKPGVGEIHGEKGGCF